MGTKLAWPQRESCKGCIYYQPVWPGGEYRACHYLYYTHNLRECDAENCDKKMTRGKRRK
nr:MAG TPA: hypothetical protein [Caudoviricetes sp.]